MQQHGKYLHKTNWAVNSIFDSILQFVSVSIGRNVYSNVLKFNRIQIHNIFFFTYLRLKINFAVDEVHSLSSVLLLFFIWPKLTRTNKLETNLTQIHKKLLYSSSKSDTCVSHFYWNTIFKQSARALWYHMRHPFLLIYVKRVRVSKREQRDWETKAKGQSSVIALHVSDVLIRLEIEFHTWNQSTLINFGSHGNCNVLSNSHWDVLFLRYPVYAPPLSKHFIGIFIFLRIYWFSYSLYISRMLNCLSNRHLSVIDMSLCLFKFHRQFT